MKLNWNLRIPMKSLCDGTKFINLSCPISMVIVEAFGQNRIITNVEDFHVGVRQLNNDPP